MARNPGCCLYDDAFRAEAVSLLIEQKMLVSTAAKQVGVSYETLPKWINNSVGRARTRYPNPTGCGSRIWNASSKPHAWSATS